MTPNILTLRHSCAALAATGALVGALATPIGSAAAQTTYQSEEMTIYAPHVYHRPLGRTSTGIPVEEMSLSRVVDYSDLNLRRWRDVQRLHERIREAAYATCHELNRQYPEALYPDYDSDGRSCVAKATGEGEARAQWAIARAHGYRRY